VFNKLFLFLVEVFDSIILMYHSLSIRNLKNLFEGYRLIYFKRKQKQKENSVTPEEAGRQRI